MLEHIRHAEDSEVIYINVAVDLLRQMMSELQGLTAKHSGFTQATVGARSVLKRRLEALEMTTGLLSSVNSLDTARSLTRHAKSLIEQMAAELDDLIASATSYH
jgi:hypothetical protein